MRCGVKNMLPLIFITTFFSAMFSAENNRNRIAIVTGGTRGIGRGITEALADSGDYGGFLLTYNTNREAAEAFVSELNKKHTLQVELVGGDISLPETRDAIFDCLDDKFKGCLLAVVVHNAGQYVGITSDNAVGLSKQNLAFGDGSLLQQDGKVNLDTMRYYQHMYGEAYVDLCERGLERMKKAAQDGVPYRGSLIGISSPGCNILQRPALGYDMPGSGKCVMEYAMRLFALRAAPLGINCNVIIPGATRTDAWSRLEESRDVAKGQMIGGMVSRAVPMGIQIDPKEIGDAVAFLAGSGGGKFITGVSLPVDGGFHLGPTVRPSS